MKGGGLVNGRVGSRSGIIMLGDRVVGIKMHGDCEAGNYRQVIPAKIIVNVLPVSVNPIEGML